MEVYILIECTDQNDYTEGQYFSSAAPAREIVGVYGNILKANEEKDRLEALMEPCDDEDDSQIYYEIETHTVK